MGLAWFIVYTQPYSQEKHWVNRLWGFVRKQNWMRAIWSQTAEDYLWNPGRLSSWTGELPHQDVNLLGRRINQAPQVRIIESLGPSHLAYAPNAASHTCPLSFPWSMPIFQEIKDTFLPFPLPIIHFCCWHPAFLPQSYFAGQSKKKKNDIIELKETLDPIPFWTNGYPISSWKVPIMDHPQLLKRLINSTD